MDFRKRLWMKLERILMKQACEFEIQPFINKDPDPRNRDYTFFLTGDSCEVEIAFFYDFIHVCSDQEPQEPIHISYQDPLKAQHLQDALAAVGITVDLQDLFD